MHKLRIMAGVSLSLSLLLCAAAPVSAQEFTKDSFPQTWVARPIVLPHGMVEFQAGGQSDVAGQAADQIRTNLNLYYGLADRFQTGLESDIEVAPSDAFQVRDVAFWGQYNIVPKLNIRGGGYMYIPRDVAADKLGDAIFGLRLGLPMKFKLSPSAAFRTSPRFSTEVSGDAKARTYELPIGLDLQVVPQFVLYANTGMASRNFSFEEADLSVPFAGGAVLSPTRLFDIGAEFRIDDVSDEAGRDSRWLQFWLALRK